MTYVSSINDFGNNSTGEVINALTTFGYTTDQFEVSSLDFGNNDLGFQIHWTGDEFGNVNLPNISVDVNESNPADDIPTQMVEFAPFLADGVTPNTDAVRFNINSFSRTFNDNEEFYSSQNRGEFDLRVGLYPVSGGLGQVPLEGGGIPQLTDDGSFIEPFDAFSLRVFINQPVTDLVIGVNPGEDAEATLLYGRDDAVPQDMVLIQPQNANITINAGDNNQPGALAIAPGAVSVNEDAGTVSLTVSRTGGSDGAVSVDFATASGTATSGSDFTANSGTLSFADGETSKTVVVSITDDSDVESSEDFTVTLSNVTGGASLGTSVSTVTILDNDAVAQPGVLSIDPASVSVNEGAGIATLTVNRANGSAGAVSVGFTTANGTAIAGSDYTANSGTLNFADGQTSQTITVAITDDAADEADETFTVALSNPTGGATLGTSTSTVTILDNDAAPQPGVLSIDPTSVSVNENAGTVTLTVRRASGTSGAVSAAFTTANGTATAGSDYVANSGTVNFADGETSKTVTVSITDDAVDENDETFTVTLSGPTGGATLGAATSTVTILDNDGVTPVPGVLSISPPTLSVNENGGNATFTVNRTGGSDGAVAVNFATANGTATAGSDYTATNGTLNFADGQTSMTINVPIINDTLDENNETFSVTLSSPTGGASLGTTTVSTATIIDDDEPAPTPGVLSISPGSVSVNENAGTVSFTINRTGGSDGAVSVSIATANGSATAGQDYTANSSTLNFAAGETSKSFTVSIIDDVIDEVNETFSVSLSSPTGGATLGTVTVSTVTIIDNDVPGGVPGSTISGAIFIDHVENSVAIRGGADPIRNGLKDSDENGLSGVAVRLVGTDSSGQAVNRSALTGAQGGYTFSNVVPGNYQVIYDVPNTVIFLGASQVPVSIPTSGGATVPNVNFALLGTQGAAMSSADILSSSYLRTNATIAQISNGGREGGTVSLDALGNQNFIVVGSGFEDADFVEFVLNAERDAALLTIVEDGVVSSARLTSDHFVVTPDGMGVQFFGGMNDFVWINSGADAFEEEFANYRNAVDTMFGVL